MSSALPPNSDIAGRGFHFAFVPNPEVGYAHAINVLRSRGCRSYNIWGKHERPSLPGKLLNRRGEQIAASISWVAYSQYLAGAGEAQSRPVSCPDTEFDSIDAGCS